MNEEIHNSDSEYQIFLEQNIIFPKLKKHLFKNIELRSDAYILSECSFQVDFYNVDHKIYGEIYSCKFPLKSGHLRKIKGDLLKLLTIEQMLGHTISKYLILTIEQSEQNGEFIPESIVHKFGLTSWFSQAIIQFDFKIYYYVLDEIETKQLNETRHKQKEGMRAKKTDKR